MTEQEYKNIIVPFFNEVKTFLKKDELNSNQRGERLFVENLLVKIIKCQNDPEGIYKAILRSTAEEREICAKYNINIAQIKETLEKE